ncbi:MAG: hypothetical protein RL350_209 [Pseudomonadota bacterium]
MKIPDSAADLPVKTVGEWRSEIRGIPRENPRGQTIRVAGKKTADSVRVLLTPSNNGETR